jgi:hypothetical protein
MTNKRHDWMTPEEAARELGAEDFCWAITRDNEVLACQIELSLSCNRKVVYLVGDECYTHFDCGLWKAFCRAIVPEVPSE